MDTCGLCRREPHHTLTESADDYHARMTRADNRLVDGLLLLLATGLAFLLLLGASA